MALEDAPRNPLGRIDVQSLIGRPDVIVEPAAITAAQNAFTQGVQLANQFSDRQAAAPIRAAEAALATDPQLVDARRRKMIADALASEVGAQSEQFKLQQAQAMAKIPPIVNQMQAELAKVGMQVPTAPADWTSDDSRKVYDLWRGVEEWKTSTASAKAALDLLKPQEIVENGKKKLVMINEKSATPVSSAKSLELQDWLTKNQTPKQYIANGNKPAPSLFDTAPGQVAGTTPASAGTAGATGTDGMVIGADIKSPTESQTKAGMAVARALEANEVFANLEKAGFNPGSFSNWAQELLVGPLKAFQTADKRSYDAAKSAWIQGLLRLESGAAIAAKEQAWYETTFFPTGLEPESVQKQKAKMRADVEKIATEIAKSGHLDVPALLNVRAQGDALKGAGATGPTGQKQVTITGVGTGYFDPTTQRFIVTQQPTNAPGSKYVQPDSLKSAPKSTKAVVEPKGAKNITKDLLNSWQYGTTK